MRNVVTLGILLATSVASLPAQAAEDPEFFSLGAGLLGVAGGNFQSKPADKTLPGTPWTVDLHPGFAGTAVGGGLMVDARFYGIIGRELDLIQSTDEGTGTLTLNTADHDITIGQSALHVPLLLKASLPAGLVTPSIFVGPEFVFVGDATASTVYETRLSPLVFEARNSNYTALAFGIGFEFAIVEVEGVGIRLPLTMRGSYNGGVSDKITDRMEATTPTTLRYESNPEFQALFTLGAAAYF